MDPALRDRWLAETHHRLAEAGLRLGAARSRVIETMAREGQCLTGVPDITGRIRAGGSRVSQASVYRILDELHGLGLVRRSTDEHGALLFEIADPTGSHDHLIDEETGRVVAFEDPELRQALRSAAERLGMELTGHEVVLRGRRRPVGAD